jgi:hypothetical protein
MTPELVLTKGRIGSFSQTAPGVVMANFIVDFDQFTEATIRIDFGFRGLINPSKLNHSLIVRVGGTFDALDGTIVVTIPWVVPGIGPQVGNGTIARPSGLTWVKFTSEIPASGFTENSHSGYFARIRGV